MANLRCNTSCLNTGLRGKFGNSNILCSLCGQTREEDLNHFIFSCSEFNAFREQMLTKIVEQIPYFTNLDFDEKMKRLFIKPKENVKIAFENYIIKAYEQRLQF